MESAIPGQLDGSDTLVGLFAWIFTSITAKLVKDKAGLDKIRHFLPLISLASAVAFRAGIEAMQGREITAETLTHALIVGGVAVVSHSQIREVIKVTTKAPAPPIDPLLEDVPEAEVPAPLPEDLPPAP